MRSAFFTGIALVFITGCYTQEPIAKQTPRNNTTYEVEYLFEYDGCKVYRFEDKGRDVYFTNCQGETIGMTDSTQIRNTTNIKRGPTNIKSKNK